MKFRFMNRIVITKPGFYESVEGTVVDCVASGVIDDMPSYLVNFNQTGGKKWFTEDCLKLADEHKKDPNFTFIKCNPKDDDPFFKEPT